MPNGPIGLVERILPRTLRILFSNRAAGANNASGFAAVPAGPEMVDFYSMRWLSL